MILEGENAIAINRKLMEQQPKDAEENTIRTHGISIDKNSVHGSDSMKTPKKK